MRNSVALTTVALAMILVGPGSQLAHADAASEFKKGCEGTGPGPHNSYVENADNVQCNTLSGTTITCDKKITHCSASAEVTHTEPIRTTAGALQKYMTGKDKIAPPHGWTILKTKGAK